LSGGERASLNAQGVAAIEGLAALARDRGDLERAARVLGAADALREVTGLCLAPRRRPGRAALLEALEAELGAKALAQALATGRRLPWARVHELALADSLRSKKKPRKSRKRNRD
jgi:hypothetical protein